MRVLLVLSLIFALCCLPLRAALTPEQVAEYTAKLQGDDEKAYQDAANKLAADKQVDVLLAALKSDKVACRTGVIYSLQRCMDAAVLEALLGVLQGDPEPRVRNVTVSIISSAYTRPELKDKQPAVLAALKGAANDADGFVARDAVIAVTRMAPEDVDFLLDVLAQGRTGMVRGQASRMLTFTKDPRAYDALVKAVADPDVAAGSAAVIDLGRLGDKRAAPLLLGVLQDQARHPQFATNAAHALAALAAPEVLEPLLQLAQTGSPRMREHALAALGGYTDPRVAPLMVTALSDRNEWTRTTAARILANLQYAPAADALLAQYPKETGASPRGEMLRALAALAEPRARDLFTAALTDRDRTVRINGIQGLLALDDETAYDTLLKMLQGTANEDISTAVRLLGNSGRPRAIEPLLQYFQRKREQKPNTGWGGEEDDAIRKLTGGDIMGLIVLTGVNRAAPVAIAIKRADGGPLTGGEVMEVLITLYNRSKHAVVVQELIPTFHRGEDPIILSSAVYGEITPGKGSYRYRELSQQASRIPLHAGLLLPGQAMQVKTAFRPVSVNERFLVRYLQAAQPYDGTPASLAPLTVFIPDLVRDTTERLFVPFTDAGWHTVCRSMPVAMPTGPGAAERAVIVEFAPDVTVQEEPMMSYPRIDFAHFLLLDRVRRTAADIAQRPIDDLALGYSKALGGYVVAEGNRRWLLTGDKQPERGKTLPTFPLPLLKDADQGGIRVQIDPQQPAAKPEGQRFWEVYPVEQGDGMYTRGLFITVDDAALPAFLDAVLAHKGSLEMHEYFFRSRYYVLKL